MHREGPLSNEFLPPTFSASYQGETDWLWRQQSSAVKYYGLTFGGAFCSSKTNHVAVVFKHYHPSDLLVYDATFNEDASLINIIIGDKDKCYFDR